MIRGHCTTIMPRIVAIELLTYWFVRAECSTADEPGQVARIGGLSNFGKVSGKKPVLFLLSTVKTVVLSNVVDTNERVALANVLNAQVQSWRMYVKSTRRKMLERRYLDTNETKLSIERITSVTLL